MATVADLMERWRAARWASWSVKYRAQAFDYIDHKINPYIGHLPIDTITAGDLEQLYGRLITVGSANGGPLSASSAKRAHTFLNAAFNKALAWQLIARNPAAAAESPRPRRTEIVPLAVDQIGAALAAETHPH